MKVEIEQDQAEDLYSKWNHSRWTEEELVLMRGTPAGKVKKAAYMAGIKAGVTLGRNAGLEAAAVAIWGNPKRLIHVDEAASIIRALKTAETGQG